MSTVTAFVTFIAVLQNICAMNEYTCSCGISITVHAIPATPLTAKMKTESTPSHAKNIIFVDFEFYRVCFVTKSN